MVFSLTHGLTATLALLAAASRAVALESGNYRILTNTTPNQYLGTVIPATPVTSTISNLDYYDTYPEDVYTWTIHKIPHLPNNYTMQIKGRWSLLGLNDVYVSEDASEEEAQVWVLEPSSNANETNYYRILTADGSRKWAMPAEFFPTLLIQVLPIAPTATKLGLINGAPGVYPASDLFIFKRVESD